MGYSKFVFGMLVLLGMLWGCESKLSNQKQLSDFIPASSEKVFKINRWEFTQSEYVSNPLLQQLQDEPFIRVLEKFETLFKEIKIQDQMLMCLSPGDSIPIFTLLSNSQNLVFNKDSLSDYTTSAKSYHDFRFQQNRLQENDFFEITIDSVTILTNSEKNLQKILDGQTQKDPQFLKALKVKDHQGLIVIEKTSGLLQDYRSLPFSTYATYELQVLPNGLTGKGVVLERDSIIGLLSLFKGQIPQKIDAPMVIPVTAKEALSFTFDKIGVLEQHLNVQTKDSTSLHPIFETVQEVVRIQMDTETVIALKSLDATQAVESLAKYLSEKDPYREVARFDISSEAMIFEPFTPWLGKLNPQIIFSWENFIFFTETDGISEEILNALSSSSVLGETNYYQQASAVLPQSGSCVEYTMNENAKGFFTKLLGASPSTIKNHPLVITQLIYDRDFAHLNFVAKEQTGQQPSAGLIQQLSAITLEAEVLGSPQFFTNHYTYGKDIVVQDVENNLYLIDVNGKILWKKQLDGPILGKVNEVDLLKNGKRQMAFATTNTLYIIDRKGNPVAPYPKRFKDEITQPLSVFDYDNNRKYRFLITQENRVYMYDTKGRSVKGFTFEKTQSPIVMPPEHIRIGNKDYILIPEKNGRLNILSRVGKNRVNVNESFTFSTIPIEKEGSSFVVITEDLKKKSIAQSGKVTTQTLNVSNNYWFTIKGSTKVTLDDNLMRINGKLIELPIGFYGTPILFSVGQKTYVGITELQENKVYLYTKDGKLLQNFPVYGTSEIDLSDANKNGKMNLVVQGGPKEIIVYQAN